MDPLPMPPGSDGRAVRDTVLLLALAALIWFPSFPLRELWTPDEPRYMEVAREMAVTDNYLVPHLSGERYPDKPPVFFWLAAAFYHLGFGLASGRMVAALAVMGTALVTYRLACRWMPRPGPLVAGCVVLTTFLFIRTKAGVIDPLLAFFVVAAVGCGHAALQPETRRRAAWWLGAYVLAALAVLTKGPVGVAVPGLILAAYGLADRGRVRGGGWVHAAGAALFLALIGAWIVPAMIAGGPEYAREIGLEQTLRRVTRSFSHRQPPYYYAVSYPWTFFPWSLVFPLALVAAIRRWRREGDAGARLMVVWFIVTVVFFSAISGKRHGYLMPVVPAVGLCIGAYVERVLREGPPWPRWHAALWGLTFGLLALMGVVIAGGMLALPKIVEYAASKGRACSLGAGGLLSPGFRMGGGLAGVVLVAAAGYGLATVIRKRYLLAVSCTVASILIASLAFDLVIVPKVNRFKSPKPFSEEIGPYLAKADDVYLLGSNLSGCYNLYTGRVHIPVLDRKEEVLQAFSSRRRVAVIAGTRKQKAMDVVDWKSYPAPVRRRVGSRQMELILNWDPNTGEVLPLKPAAERR